MPDPAFLGTAFNFGTETPVSVTACVAQLLSLMNRTDLEPMILNQASNEIPRQYLDCSRARTLMDWRPRWTVDDAFRETIEWYRSWLDRRNGAQSESGTRSAASGPLVAG
jgi:CDP-glucose 4,6-dehydratase